MALDDGRLYAADGRGCCACVEADGRTVFWGDVGGVPNGICVDREGNCIIANIGNGEVQSLSADGRHTVLMTEAEGRRMYSPNFPYLDFQERLWVSNSTQGLTWMMPSAPLLRMDAWYASRRGKRGSSPTASTLPMVSPWIPGNLCLCGRNDEAQGVALPDPSGWIGRPARGLWTGRPGEDGLPRRHRLRRSGKPVGHLSHVERHRVHHPPARACRRPGRPGETGSEAPGTFASAERKGERPLSAASTGETSPSSRSLSWGKARSPSLKGYPHR